MTAESENTPLQRRRELSPRERRLAEEYLKDGDLLRSYLASGYPMATTPSQSKSLAKKILARARVVDYMEKLQAAADERQHVSPESILRQFQEVVEECRRRGDFGNANRALENLGKARGLFDSISRHQVVVTHLETGKTLNEVKADIKRLSKIIDVEVSAVGAKTGG